jgi:hypothetical protein
MFDRANVVSYVHTSTLNFDGPTFTGLSDTNTIEHRIGESMSKSHEPKRKEDIFMEHCIGEMKKSNKSLKESLKASDDMKIDLYMSIQ